jgi:hypothetical protein
LRRDQGLRRGDRWCHWSTPVADPVAWVVVESSVPEGTPNTHCIRLAEMAQDTQPDERDPLLDEVDTLVYFTAPGDADFEAKKAAIKIVHRATGIEVMSDTEPTQAANRARALAILRDRLASRPG